MNTNEIDRKLLAYYASIMSEIKNRAKVINSIYEKKVSTRYILTDIEFCALQLRKILELLLVSTLVANKKEYEKQSKSFDKNWSITKKLNEIKKINPDYFPIGMILSSAELPSYITNHQLIDINSKEVFKEKDFYTTYSFTSKYLHVQNPFKAERIESKAGVFFADLKEYLTNIMNLLRIHRVTPCNGDIIICDIKNRRGKGEGIRVRYFELEKSEITFP